MLRQVVCPYVRATPSLQGTQLYLLAKVIIFHQFSTFLCLLFEGQQVIDGKFKGLTGRVARYQGQQRVAIIIDGGFTMATAYLPTAFLEYI